VIRFEIKCGIVLNNQLIRKGKIKGQPVRVEQTINGVFKMD
jgi:hypothetical protein